MTAVIALGLYALVVAGLLRANHFAQREPDPNPIRGAYPSCVPVRPRITQADVDATWLDQWPTDVEPADIDTLEQRVYDRLFDDILAIEGLQ